MPRAPQPPLPSLFEPAPALEGGPVAPSVAAAAPHPDAPPIDDEPENPVDLTPREALFVTAYTGVALGNATKAYALAGYSTRGPATTARSNAANLLAKPRVSQAVAARMSAIAASLDGAMAREEAIRRLSVIARGDPREIWAHEPLIARMPDHVAACVKGVRRTDDGLHLEVYDRVHALEVVGKWLGMATESVHVVHASLEEVLAASRRPTLDAEAVAS